VEEARAIGVGLEMALFAADEPGEQLAGLRRLLDELRPPVCAWLCYPEHERYAGGSPNGPVVEAARRALESYDPGIPFYTGTNTDFIFLKRSAPPLEPVDGITLAICPQVHAFDNASLVETLQVQGSVVESARRLGQGKPVMVSPVTLKMRFNPYATAAPATVPAGELPPQVDVRQMSLFGAAWTLGSIRSLADSKTESITYYETTGWRGMMETVRGSELPGRFHSFPGGVYPLYHVLAAVGEFAGGRILPVRVSHPLQATALLLQQGGRERLMVANLSPDKQALQVEHLTGEYRVQRLDEDHAVEAMQQPERFREQYAETVIAADGEVQLELLPYATVVLDAVGKRVPGI
jgi:hypothetical protein